MVEVDLVAEISVINPFDFFLEPYTESFRFAYEEGLMKELAPNPVVPPPGPRLADFIAATDLTGRRTVDFLIDLNQRLQHAIKYVIRLEPGIQSSEQTFELGSGSCRDSAWLLVEILRNLGLAARFESGYLIQLKPDVNRDRSSRVGGGLSAGRGMDRARSDLGALCRRGEYPVGEHA
jgi:transglutaminase-like putative cysteine protease